MEEIIMGEAKKKKGQTPDRQPINKIQAQRLASLTGVSAKEITGKNVLELSEKLKWRIDPELFFFRRICGRVVKKDPATGTEHPVPFATVHVEDTDCSFLGFFPLESPLVWFFPFFCHREEITTTVTDACGRFCVFVPRWEVDWILRFRHDHICFPDIFIKPTIRDILDGLYRPPIKRPPKPEPDPLPFLLKDGGITLRRAEELFGRDIAGKLAALGAGAAVGASSKQQLKILDSMAFSRQMPPPLSSEFKRLTKPDVSATTRLEVEEAQNMTAVRETMAKRLKINAQHIEKLNFQHFIGPFRRCFDVIFPEWMPILDVPDITFRVTQDVNGDGNEETIYSEGFFDVRWNAGNIPDVTLEASQISVAGVACNPPEVPCEDVPAILFAGLMPLINPPGPADPYYDVNTGYAQRPNRPHSSGNIAPLLSDLPLDVAQTPYTHTLQLYGCNHGEGAVYYRLRYGFNGSPPVSFTGLTWPLHRVVGGILHTLWPTSDANGWYPILPDADGWFPQSLLLNWPTGNYQNGTYAVELELGNASKTVINTSAPVKFRIDNSVPSAQFTKLRWRKVGDVDWSLPVSLICPVIPRPTIGGNPVDIEIEVSYMASASHLRSVVLSGGGCGGGSPTLSSALSTAQHWHTIPADNSVINTAVFSLSGLALQGAYSFNLLAVSRAFNPAGGDGGFEADWNYDPVYNYIWPTLPVAVVNV